MIGNDVIDIAETKKTTNWERPGFLDKIFTRYEQCLIRSSEDPFTMVWQLWSMKESAYKAYVQKGSKRFFNPTKLECDLAQSGKGRVTVNGVSINTTTWFDSEYLFTNTVLKNIKTKSAIFHLKINQKTGLSDYMHNEVLCAIAARYSFNKQALRLQKTANGVPLVFHRKERIDVSFSITHHGKFGAYSIMY